MDISLIAKWLVFIGIGIVLFGALLWIGGKFGFPIGQLPGDIHVSKDKFTFYAPIVTSLILSVLLTIIINLILWILQK